MVSQSVTDAETLLPTSSLPERSLPVLLALPRFGREAFAVAGAATWNELRVALLIIFTVASFKKKELESSSISLDPLTAAEYSYM